ncbi:MAG: hypothetical protein LBS06_08270 [Treponema sp.]|jgi:hypothetical protein|nr:hypothetical protein [Treponema sp.]
MLSRFVTAGLLAAVCFFSAAVIFPQNGEDDAAAIFSQGGEAAGETAVSAPATIPEALRRPRRGEAGRYPVDTIIGPLGAGDAEEAAYRFAGDLLGALTAGNRGAPVLSTIESGALDTILEDLQAISPLSCRLGSGKEEADGAVSFLVRFIGREKGISGELYIRADEAGAGAGEAAAEVLPVTAGHEPAEGGDGSAAAETGGRKNAVKAVWRFDDLVLEEPGDRGAPAEEGRFDFVPYERFF